MITQDPAAAVASLLDEVARDTSEGKAAKLESLLTNPEAVEEMVEELLADLLTPQETKP